MSPTKILSLLLFTACTSTLLAQQARENHATLERTPQAPQGSVALTPAVPLPGDTALAPARGKQERPQIAKGADTSLVVWADTRSALAGNSTISVGGAGPYFGTGLGTMNDIYAARLDQNGTVIDSHPIIVSQASYSQNHPRVGWNGENWLIAWVEEHETNYYEYRIRAARVSPAGVVLDATPLTIAANVPFGDFPTRVTFDGSNWVVVWDGFGTSQTARSVFVSRVSPAGAVIDPGGIAIYTHSSQYLANSDLAFNGSGFLLTFRDMIGETIYGRRYTAALQPVGFSFAINNFSPSKPTHVRVTSNGDGYFLAWDEHAASGNIGSLRGARVSSSGQVLDPASIVIDSNVGTSETVPDVTWNGTVWSVAYNSGYYAPTGAYGNHDVYLRRVSTAGAVLDAAPIVLVNATNHQLLPAITPGANGAVQVVWQDMRAAEEDVYTAHVSSAGAVTNQIPVSLGAPRQSRPRMAFGGGVFLSVFQREIAGSWQVYGQRLDGAGNAVDAEPFQITDGTNPRTTNPSVAFNGTHFLVVWDQPFTDEFGNVIQKVHGRRLSPSGAFADAAPFYIMDGLTPDVAALGDTFLTVAIRRIGQQLRYVEAVRVSGGGVVLGSPTLVLTNYNFAPRVAALGNRWLVVWEYHSRHDISRSWIRGSFVDTTGAATESFQVAVSDSQFGTGNSYDDTPHLAAAGNEALIVWADNDNNQQDIKGRRITADGTLLGSNFAFTISGAPGGQFLPAVAWDGTNYVVTWVDQRTEQYPVQPRGNIFAARVAPNDTVLDPDGFPVANTAAPEETPFVGSANGSTIFAYSAFYPQAPHSAMRVTTRSMFSSLSDGVTAFSRKMHSAMGAGDIPLPLTGTVGIDPRSGGAGGNHQIVVNFPMSVTVSGAKITSGVGSVAGMSVAGSQVTVDLSGIANAQRLTLTLSGVNNSGDVTIPFAVLLGDVNQNGVVSSSDVGMTKAMSGQELSGSNFQSDVNLSGSINSSDLGMVKSQSGAALP